MMGKQTICIKYNDILASKSIVKNDVRCGWCLEGMMGEGHTLPRGDVQGSG